MTRKDYETLAAALKANCPADIEHQPGPAVIWQAYRLQWTTDCEAIAKCIAKNNRAFDVNLFLRNCGVKV